MNNFKNASWICKQSKVRPNKRKIGGGLRHFPIAIMRRFVDKLYQKLGYQNRDMLAAPIFRKKICINNVQSALVKITGLGYFELYVNGKKVSDDVLSPPFSQYEKTVYYHTYELKEYLINGDNIITVQLGNGMYNVHYPNAWNYDVCQWRGLPKFILEGNIIADETTLLISDESWFVTTGAIISNDIYGGEIYDARKELTDWNYLDFDKSKYESAVLTDSPTSELLHLNIEPIREIKKYKTVDYWKIEDKKWIFDIGTNISGYIQLKASAPRGTEVKISYSERIEDRKLYMKDLHEHTHKRFTKYIQIDKYIFKGEGIEQWKPKFTYHGFQYVELEGLKEVDEHTITGILTHNDIEKIGEFSCSNDLLNNIYRATDQSYMNNVLGIPTDCPHREKNGWTGDVSLSIEYFLLSRNAEEFYTKWIKDIRDTQKPNGQICCIAPSPGWGYNLISGPVWDSTFIIIPYNMYRYKNNIQILKDNYDAMKQYIIWQNNKASKHIIRYGLGDWCSPNRPPNKPKVPTALTSTLFHYETLKMMTEIAHILGKKEDEKWYQEQVKLKKESIINKFINQKTGFVSGDCQTSYSAVLYFDVVPKSLIKKVVEKLVQQVKKYDYHLDTGIIGTKFLLDVLSRYGYHDLAYRIVSQKTFPSWGYWIELGATTLWENWNGNQSRNHRMFGSVASWMYNHLVGFRYSNDISENKIVISPKFTNQLDWVEGSTKINNQDVTVRWERKEDTYTLTIKAPKDFVIVCIDQKYKHHMIHNHEHSIRYT